MKRLLTLSRKSKIAIFVVLGAAGVAIYGGCSMFGNSDIPYGRSSEEPPTPAKQTAPPALIKENPADKKIYALPPVPPSAPQPQAPTPPSQTPETPRKIQPPPPAAPPKAVKPSHVEKSPDFAGPLQHKGYVRTYIFGEYKPTASMFEGERHNARGHEYGHQGVDVLCPIGTPLIAPDDGLVVEAGGSNGGYGHCVLIRVQHDGRYLYVLYAHMSSVKVKRGQTVKRGQVVGASGNSGNAGLLPDTEEHVHVEVRTVEKVAGGTAGRIDPLDYFTNVVPPKEAR